VIGSWTTSLFSSWGQNSSELIPPEVLIECRQLADAAEIAKERRNKIDGSRHCLVAITAVWLVAASAPVY